MKKAKNIILLSGIICNFTIMIWQLIQLTYRGLTSLTGKNLTYFLKDGILPITIIFLLLIIPVILLVENLKNKTTKALPIISITINFAVLLWVLFFSLAPEIPQYLVMSELGFIDTYLVLIVNFLRNGGLLFVVGYAALIIGSFLSLPKKKR